MLNTPEWKIIRSYRNLRRIVDVDYQYSLKQAERDLYDQLCDKQEKISVHEFLRIKTFDSLSMSDSFENKAHNVELAISRSQSSN